MTDRRRKPKSPGARPLADAALGISDGGVFPLFRGDGSIAGREDFDRAFVDPIERFVVGDTRWLAVRTIGTRAGETYTTSAHVLNKSLAAIEPAERRKELVALATEFWSHLQRQQGYREWNLAPAGKFKDLAGAIATGMTAALAAIVAARGVIANMQVESEKRQAGLVSPRIDRRPARCPDGTKDHASLVPGPAFEAQLCLMRNCGFAALSSLPESGVDAIATASVISEALDTIEEANAALEALEKSALAVKTAIKEQNRRRTEKPLEKKINNTNDRLRIVKSLMITLMRALPGENKTTLVREYLQGLYARVVKDGMDTTVSSQGEESIANVKPIMCWEMNMRQIEKYLMPPIEKQEVKRFVANAEGGRQGLAISTLLNMVTKLKKSGDL